MGVGVAAALMVIVHVIEFPPSTVTLTSTVPGDKALNVVLRPLVEVKLPPPVPLIDHVTLSLLALMTVTESSTPFPTSTSALFARPLIEGTGAGVSVGFGVGVGTVVALGFTVSLYSTV